MILYLLLGLLILPILLLLIFLKRILRMRKAGCLIIFKNYWDVFLLIGGTISLCIGIGLGYGEYDEYQEFVKKELEINQLESTESDQIIEDNKEPIGFIDYLQEKEKTKRMLTSIILAIGGCLAVFFSLKMSYTCNKDFGNLSIFISILIKLWIVYLLILAAGLSGKRRDDESSGDYIKRSMMAAGLGAMVSLLLRPGGYQDTDDEDMLDAADLLASSRDGIMSRGSRRNFRNSIVGEDGAGNYTDEE